MILPAHLTDQMAQFIRPLGRYSLPDWAFLPLAGLAGAGLIALAMGYRPGFQAPTYTETSFVMREAALGELIPGPGTRFELITEGVEAPIAQISAVASFDSAGLQSAGVGAALITDWETRVAGRMLRIEVEAKRGEGAEIDQIRVGYFTTGYGDSERTLVSLTEDWQTVGICFQVPDTAQPTGQESVGIWPGDDGNGEPVLVRQIEITIEPDQTSLETCQSHIGAER